MLFFHIELQLVLPHIKGYDTRHYFGDNNHICSNALCLIRMHSCQKYGITDYQVVLWFNKESNGNLEHDLYKVYGNKLLDRLVASLLGIWIGDSCCAALICADDLALSSRLQWLVNIGVDFSILEKFLLQHNKSVILSHLCALDKKLGMTNEEWTTYDEPVPVQVVKEATHMGILRSHCTEESAVTENIKKARGTVYSLMSSSLHRQNGLDPETCIGDFFVTYFRCYK